jgi:hypothetical protein
LPTLPYTFGGFPTYFYTALLNSSVLYRIVAFLLCDHLLRDGIPSVCILCHRCCLPCICVCPNPFQQSVAVRPRIFCMPLSFGTTHRCSLHVPLSFATIHCCLAMQLCVPLSFPTIVAVWPRIRTCSHPLQQSVAVQKRIRACPHPL